MEQNNQLVATQKGNAITNFFNPSTMGQMLEMCKMFTKSLLVPDMYRAGGVLKQGENKSAPSVVVTEEQATANVFLALDFSNRMGVNPLMVMQNLYIVKGKPSWSSSFLIATVNTCGRFKPLKFYITAEKSGDGKLVMVQPLDADGHPKGAPIPNMTCIAYTCEVGVAPEDEKKNMLTSTTISMRMAIDEGWMSKSGSKWQTMPEQMLRYRAAAFWVRTYAPEISMGMYTADEMNDIQDADFTDISTANSGLIDMDAEMKRVEEETAKPSAAQVMAEQGEKADWKKAAKKQAEDDTDVPF